MSSLRRRLASQANGALCLGPVTPEGKRRSSQNAERHSLLSRNIVMRDESPESFAEVVEDHLNRLRPADGVEFGMVEEMVSAYWRLRRAWAMIAMRRAFTSCTSAPSTTCFCSAPPAYQTNLVPFPNTRFARRPDAGTMPGRCRKTGG